MYQWRKGIASWEIGKTLYISVPFSWLMSKAKEMEAEYDGKVLIGGPGTGKKNQCVEVEPLLFHNPLATFTTRGCPNNCGHCLVPIIEGDLEEIEDFRVAPVICDNNLLAASWNHLCRVIYELKRYRFVDFNQGLEAARFTPKIADQIGQLKCKVRFAFDRVDDEAIVKEAIDLCRERTTKNIGIYVLIGYDDYPAEAIYKLETVRSWGIRPNPMRFQPLNAVEKNAYVAEDWTEAELRKMMKYYSRLRWQEHIPYEDFDYLKHEDEGDIQMELEL